MVHRNDILRLGCYLKCDSKTRFTSTKYRFQIMHCYSKVRYVLTYITSLQQRFGKKSCHLKKKKKRKRQKEKKRKEKKKKEKERKAKYNSYYLSSDSACGVMNRTFFFYWTCLLEIVFFLQISRYALVVWKE